MFGSVRRCLCRISKATEAVGMNGSGTVLDDRKRELQVGYVAFERIDLIVKS